MARATNDRKKQDSRRDAAAIGGSNQGNDAANVVGDNRRAGDLDGNKTGGDSKSPGATEASDESEGGETVGSRRGKRTPTHA